MTPQLLGGPFLIQIYNIEPFLARVIKTTKVNTVQGSTFRLIKTTCQYRKKCRFCCFMYLWYYVIYCLQHRLWSKLEQSVGQTIEYSTEQTIEQTLDYRINYRQDQTKKGRIDWRIYSFEKVIKAKMQKQKRKVLDGRLHIFFAIFCVGR